jgi:hypothetical protein
MKARADSHDMMLVSSGFPHNGAFRRMKEFALMATKSSIVSAINTKVGTTKFSMWRIGLTNDLATRKNYWKDTEKEDVKYWANWTADSLSDAQDIEAHFISKGMKGGTGGNLSRLPAVYVYVF